MGDIIFHRRILTQICLRTILALLVNEAQSALDRFIMFSKDAIKQRGKLNRSGVSINRKYKTGCIWMEDENDQ